MRHRIFWTALLIGFIIFFIGIPSVSASKGTLSHTINLAGKQRMLTQKMSKEAFFIAKGIHVQRNKQRLARSIALFEKTLQGLFRGDKDLGLVRTKNRTIRYQLYRVKRLWKPFRRYVKLVQRGKTSRWVLRQVERRNLPLLRAMDRAVQMFEKQVKKASKKLTPDLAHKINLAGKQRMLTQKMTKELLLISLNMNKKKNKLNLTRTTDLFALTLQGLFRGDRYLKLKRTKQTTIRSQLHKVRRLWRQYWDKVIWKAMKGTITKKRLEIADKLNPNLLYQMDKAVRLYEQLADGSLEDEDDLLY